MKSIRRWMNDIFGPKEMQEINAFDLLESMNDPTIRKEWLHGVFEELKRMNLEVDKRLLTGGYRIEDLCARRKAYQDILEGILSAKRSITMGTRHNRPVKAGQFDLDSVTVNPSPK
jgi:hypothetical protein